jgi:hypothetical protein
MGHDSVSGVTGHRLGSSSMAQSEGMRHGDKEISHSPISGSDCISVLDPHLSISYCNNSFSCNQIRRDIRVLSVDRWTCLASITLDTPRLMPKPGLVKLTATVVVWRHGRWPVRLYTDINGISFLSNLVLRFCPSIRSSRTQCGSKEHRHNHRASRSSSRAGVLRDRSSETGSVVDLEVAFLASYQGK